MTPVTGFLADFAESGFLAAFAEVTAAFGKDIFVAGNEVKEADLLSGEVE